jgi:imidazole glycerol phosphate synthase glutamine amidotransferase subunit
MQIAIRYETPLLFWGESLAEYQSFYSYDEMEEVDEKRFNRAMNLGITADDMYEFLGGRVAKRDLYPFVYPPRKELMRIKCRSICLGSYIKWDTKKHVEIIKRELGWKGQEVEGIPPEYDYEKIECFFQGVRDYLKFIKRGMGRTNHLANIDIRNHRMTREEGEKLVGQYDGKRPPSLDLFLDYLQLTEEQFIGIAMKHEVSPWQFSPNEVEPGRRMPDMDQWNNTRCLAESSGVEIGGKGPRSRRLADGRRSQRCQTLRSSTTASTMCGRSAMPSSIAASIRSTHDADVIADASHVICRVSAFGDAMTQYPRPRIDEMLDRHVREKASRLAVCLGMQLLAQSSEEHADDGVLHRGLGWFDADVWLMPNDPALKIPHMAGTWWPRNATIRSSPVSARATSHSISCTPCMRCNNPGDVVGFAQYGQSVTAIIAKDNIAATQFHPRRAGDGGIELVSNFLRWNP